MQSLALNSFVSYVYLFMLIFLDYLYVLLYNGDTKRKRGEGGGGKGGGGLAQSVERATPGEKVPGSIRAVGARSLLVGSVSV